MNGVEVFEYCTDVGAVMEFLNGGETRHCVGLFDMFSLVNGLM